MALMKSHTHFWWLGLRIDRPSRFAYRRTAQALKWVHLQKVKGPEEVLWQALVRKDALLDQETPHLLHDK